MDEHMNKCSYMDLLLPYERDYVELTLKNIELCERAASHMTGKRAYRAYTICEDARIDVLCAVEYAPKDARTEQISRIYERFLSKWGALFIGHY